jgi:molybdate transport system ATP-binding protein
MNDIVGRFSLPLAHFNLDVDFCLPNNAITVIYGRLGSGKTTFLRCLAGLERKAKGKLVVNKEVWQDTETKLFLPTHQRSLGFVFQKAHLLPHLDVKNNLLYGYHRVKNTDRHITFEQIVELLGLSHFLNRSVEKLSQGEAQRIAIARAFLTSPKFLLMDEPVSAFDDDSKLEFFTCLKLLRDRIKIPVVYVTHSRAELEVLADYTLLMENGRLKS